MLKKLSLLLIFLTACQGHHRSEEYATFYSYLENVPEPQFVESPYYVVLLVNARHLDYGDARSFLQTVAKHPSNGSKNGDVGHAWIYLKSPEGCLEGGHSGERGIWQPRYMEGVFDNIALGAPDPAKYLSCTQCDGYFQCGNGGHSPTFAAKIDLSVEKYAAICAYIQTYPFPDYSITEHQCTTFVTGIAHILGFELEDKMMLTLPQDLILAGRAHRLWTDPCYSTLTIGSPDRLEASLIALVQSGRAENATCWYRRTHRIPFNKHCSELFETMQKFPARAARYNCLR